MNSLVVATVTPFMKDGKETDKNGNTNFWLAPICGKMPSKALVMNGTRAKQQGIESGKTYQFMITEGEVDAEHGRQFNQTKTAEVGPLDIADLYLKLGEAKVVDTNAAEEATSLEEQMEAHEQEIK